MTVTPSRRSIPLHRAYAALSADTIAIKPSRRDLVGPVVQALLAELGEPLLTSTLILPDDAQPLSDAHVIRERLEKRVDLILDGGACGAEPTTVVDLTGDVPLITRQGRGPAEIFGEFVGA